MRERYQEVPTARKARQGTAGRRDQGAPSSVASMQNSSSGIKGDENTSLCQVCLIKKLFKRLLGILGLKIPGSFMKKSQITVSWQPKKKTGFAAAVWRH
jgi:hypothetical protein